MHNNRLRGFERGLIVFCVLFVVFALAFIEGGWRQWIAPQTVVSVAVFIIGFTLLHWQLERQHENTLEAQRLQAENKLKLAIYDKVAERMDVATAHIYALTTKPSSFLDHLRAVQSGRFTLSELPNDFFPTHNVMTLYESVSRSVVDLISVLDRYEIALDGFHTFRTELWKKLEALQPPIVPFTVNSMKFSNLPLTTSAWPPSESDYEILEATGKAIMEASIIFPVLLMIFDERRLTI